MEPVDGRAVLAVALATASALSYGAADFSGAVASKDNDATVVTAAMQVVSLLALIVVLFFYGESSYTGLDLAWGAVGGLGASLGLVMFYKALALGPMSVAAALTALWSTIVPVGAGVLLGDRPNPITVAGIVVAIPAAVLVSLEAGERRRPEPTPRDRVRAWHRQARTRRLAVVAGIGFGLFFVALAQTSADAGLYPLVGARVASIAALAIVIGSRALWSPIPRRWWPVVTVTGVLDCAANSLYLLALRYGSLTWVAAISSLYPVGTVLLARIVLSERLSPVQLRGMAMAAAALVLVGVGANA